MKKTAETIASYVPERDDALRRNALLPEAGARGNGPGKLTYRIRFRPAPDIFSHGVDVSAGLSELRRLGRCKIVTQTEDIPYLEELDPGVCYLYWDALLTTDRGEDAVRDAFGPACGGETLKIDVIDRGDRTNNERAYKKLGEILLERGDVTPGDIEEILSSQKRIGEALVEAGKVSRDKMESALAEQQYLRGLG